MFSDYSRILPHACFALHIIVCFVIVAFLKFLIEIKVQVRGFAHFLFKLFQLSLHSLVCIPDQIGQRINRVGEGFDFYEIYTAIKRIIADVVYILGISRLVQL